MLANLWMALLLAAPMAGPEDGPALAGVVVDEAGRPVGGATVAYPFGGRAEARTDASGGFRIALKAERADLARFVGVAIARAEDGRIGVADEAPRLDAVRVTVRAPRPLTVLVVDGRGRAVAGAGVDVGLGLWPAFSGLTDGSGRWSTSVPGDLKNWTVAARKGGVGFDYAAAERARGSVEPLHPFPVEVELTLDGARVVRVKAVEPDGRPIEGVRVHPWYVQKPGHEAMFNLSGDADEAKATTGADGFARIDWLPANLGGNVPIMGRATGYQMPARTEQARASEVGEQEIVLTLVRLERLGGRITRADGQPAAGAEVRLEGRGGVAYESFRARAKADAEGRYSALVAPDSAYVVAATLGSLASPCRFDAVVRAGRPTDGVDLVLGPGSVIRARAVDGSDDRPSPEIGIRLQAERGQIPDELRPKGDNLSRPIQMTWSAAPDASGRYAFLVGPGDYSVVGQSGSQAHALKVTIPREDPPAERTVDLRIKALAPVGPLALTVVDETGMPVEGALVEGIYTTPVPQVWFHPTKADARGMVRTRRSPDPLILHARRGDQLAGTLRSEADAAEARIVLRPTAMASGRLVDESGRPVVRHALKFGVRVPVGEAPNGAWTDTFGGQVETDDAGRFVLVGLAVGQLYHLNYPLDDRGTARGVGTLRPAQAGPVDLGDRSVDARPLLPPDEPKAREQVAMERAAEAFAPRASTASPADRVAATEREAAREYTRPLLLFGRAQDPACLDLFRRFNEAIEEPDPAHPRPATPAELRWEFELLPLDLDAPGIREYARAMGVAAGPASPPCLVVLGPDAKVEARYPLVPGADKKLDPGVLAGFLAPWKYPTRDARAMLAEASAKANAEGKRLFFIASASWCGPCRLLSRFLVARKAELDPHYVFVKLDVSRDRGAREVVDGFKGSKSGGVPWYAILDAEGKPMATSNLPGEDESGTNSNIGFPSDPPGVDHFVGMLRRTAPGLAEGKLRAIREALREK